jgi:hypothetical protein
MGSNAIRLAAAIGASVFLLSAANATTTKYVFSVNWSTGELASTTSQGWFAFDSSLALPNAQYFEPNLLSDFGFTLRDTFYGLASVQTGFLSFDAQSQLRLIGVGTNCGAGYCASDPGNIHSFYVVYDSQSRADRFFGVAGDPGSRAVHVVRPRYVATSCRARTEHHGSPIRRPWHCWSGASETRLTLPSSGRPQAGFAHLRPPLMSNVRARSRKCACLREVLRCSPRCRPSRSARPPVYAAGAPFVAREQPHRSRRPGLSGRVEMWRGG